MVVAVLVLVLGLLAGGVLVARPRVIGRPGRFGTRAVRAGGVLLAAVALIVGGTTVVQNLGLVSGTPVAAWERPPAAAVKLPVVGYVRTPTPGGVSVDVYYLAPTRSASRVLSLMTDNPCLSSPEDTPGAGGHLDFSVDLVWLGDRNDPASSDCSVEAGYKVERATVDPVAEVTTVTTDSAITTVDNTEVRPAASGNPVPELIGPPETDATPVDGVDLGPLPIQQYLIFDAGDGQRYLNLTYFSPQDPDAPGTARKTERGCTVTRTHSGAGTDTITVGVRLSWSDHNGRYTQADRARCRNEGPWVTTRTMQWLKISGHPKVVTDGPIADFRGEVVVPAAPGNPVPERP